MSKVKKAAMWVKKYSLWIIGFLLTIVGAALAISHEKSKVEKMKSEARTWKAKENIALLVEKRKKLAGIEVSLKMKEDRLDDTIRFKNDEIAAAKKRVEGMTDDEVTEEFNKLYPPR